MADDLQRMVDRLLAEAHRDAFGAQVTRALEMAESEMDVRAITSRVFSPPDSARIFLSISSGESVTKIVAG